MSPEEYLITLANPDYSLDIPEEDVVAIRAVTMPDSLEEAELDPITTESGEEYQPSAGEIVQELLTGLTSYQDLISNNELSAALEANHAPTQVVMSDQRGNAPSENEAFLRALEKQNGWNPAQISVDETGKRTISIQGNSEEFQGMGKYGSPEEFIRANPEGFKKANPLLAARMEAEAKAAQQAPTMLTSKILGELDAQMESIQNEKDPLKKQLMLSQLEVDVAQAGANLSKEMRLQAEHKSGIGQLRTRLQQSEMLDRKHPDFLSKYGGRDSNETAALRKQVAAAEKGIGALTKQMISENPTLAAMGVKVKNFLKMQSKDVEKDLAREDKQADILDQAEKAILPEEVRRLEFITGKKLTDRAAAETLIGFTGKESKGKLVAWNEISKAESDADMVPLAIKGNPFAKQILLRSQMEKTGQTEQEVKEDLGKVFAIMQNPTAFQDAVKTIGGENLRKLAKQHDVLVMTGKKETALQAAEIRAQVATQYARKMRENSILGNVESWNGDLTLRSNPEIAKTIDLVKTTNGGKPVSMEELVDKYVMDAPRQERATRLEDIRKSLKSTAYKYEGALFGSVDYMRLSNILDSHVAVSAQLSSRAGFGASPFGWN